MDNTVVDSLYWLPNIKFINDSGNAKIVSDPITDSQNNKKYNCLILNMKWLLFCLCNLIRPGETDETITIGMKYNISDIRVATE